MKAVDYVAWADDIIRVSMNHELINGALKELAHYDEYTFWHSVSVARISLVMGMQMDLPEDKLYRLAYGALLHDIGKLEVPLVLLQKHAQLTPLEKSVIEQHPKKGARRIEKTRLMPEDVINTVMFS